VVLFVFQSVEMPEEVERECEETFTQNPLSFFFTNLLCGGDRIDARGR
jgi:hypothetical protein